MAESHGPGRRISVWAYLGQADGTTVCARSPLTNGNGPNTAEAPGFPGASSCYCSGAALSASSYTVFWLNITVMA